MYPFTKIQTDDRKHASGGFTLPEILVSLFVLSLLGLGLVNFLNDANVIIFSSTGRLEINRDIRDFTEAMSKEARAANTFLLYRSFYPVNNGTPGGNFRDPPSGVDATDYRKRIGESGDLAIFIYEAEDPNPRDSDVPIEKIVGYYRGAPDYTVGVAPVMRFEYEVPVANRYDEIEALIPSLTDGHTTVVNLAEGLANGMLFYNFNNRSLLVNAKIVHGNIAKQITGTYNFTVSPRG